MAAGIFAGLATLAKTEMGVAAFVGFALCGIVGGVAYALVQNGVVTMDRSRDELSRNIAWLKSTLRNQSKQHATERPINY